MWSRSRRDWTETYSSSGRCAYVNDAAHIRSHRVNGSVRAKASRVDLQVGGSLIDHVTNNIHLHLENQRNTIKFIIEDDYKNVLKTLKPPKTQKTVRQHKLY